MPLKGRDRRRLKRHYHRIPATFSASGILAEARVKNVCKEGLFLRTDFLPAPGTPVNVTIDDGEGSKVEVSGTVRWTTEQLPEGTDARPGFGIQIHPVTDQFMEFFESLMLT